jgi:haloalkane dehalogenase
VTVPHHLFPFESHFVEIDGLKHHYLDEGRGAPVVMVHGNPTWSFYYRDLVAGLRDRSRTIVPDHIGCGYSDKPDDSRYEYTLRQRIDDLEALLDKLGVTENITLVVHDWGGAIGMAYAVRHPERIARLVILNTAAFHIPPSKPFPWPLWLVRDTRFGAFIVLRFNAFARIATLVACRRKKLSRELRDAYCAPYDSVANRIATLRFVQDIPLRPGDRCYDIATDVQGKLDRFKKTPTLICWGEKDFVFDHHFLREWERHLPQAEVHRFAKCGHYILEDASEEIVPLVQRFLEAHPIGSTG